jgi:hypothetical protein
MTKLLQAFGRNPDAVALVVLSVVLGVGRQACVAGPRLAISNRALGIHWVSIKPATEALDSLRTRLRELGCEAASQIHLPDFRR